MKMWMIDSRKEFSILYWPCTTVNHKQQSLNKFWLRTVSVCGITNKKVFLYVCQLILLHIPHRFIPLHSKPTLLRQLLRLLQHLPIVGFMDSRRKGLHLLNMFFNRVPASAFSQSVNFPSQCRQLVGFTVPECFVQHRAHQHAFLLQRNFFPPLPVPAPD